VYVFIEKAKYVITPVRGGGLSVYSGVDIVVENGIITCFDKTCPKPRDSLIIHGEGKAVTPSFANILAYPIESFLAIIAEDFLVKPGVKLGVLEESFDSITAYSIFEVLCTKLLFTGYSDAVFVTKHYVEAAEACRDLGLHVLAGPPLTLYWKQESASNSSRLVAVDAGDFAVQSGVVRELLENAKERGLKIVVRFTGSKREVFGVKKSTGKWPVELLANWGVLQSNVLLANPFWVTSMEIELMSEAKPLVSLSPSTSMIAGERGFPPLHKLVEKSVPVTVSSDGLHGVLNPLSELGLALLVQRYSYGDQRLDPNTLIYHTIVNPRIYTENPSRFVEKGVKALLNVYSLPSWISVINLIHYLLSRPMKPRYVIAGEVVLSDNFKTVIEVRVSAKIRYLREKIRDVAERTA